MVIPAACGRCTAQSTGERREKGWITYELQPCQRAQRASFLPESKTWDQHGNERHGLGQDATLHSKDVFTTILKLTTSTYIRLGRPKFVMPITTRVNQQMHFQEHYTDTRKAGVCPDTESQAAMSKERIQEHAVSLGSWVHADWSWRLLWIRDAVQLSSAAKQIIPRLVVWISDVFLPYPAPIPWGCGSAEGSFAGFAAGRSRDCVWLEGWLDGRPNVGLSLVWQLLLAGLWVLVLPVATHPPLGWTGFLTVISGQQFQKSRGDLGAP